MSDAHNGGAALTPLRQALLAIEDLQGRLAASEGARREPIAIVGMGLRFPGGCNTPEDYWKLLCEGVDAIVEIPPSRWAIDDYYNADSSAPGTMSQRHGGFLEDVDAFDAQFFGIAPREAVAMDPQQRLLLEVAWEALERAGLAPAQLAGTRTGVFVGVTANDYRSVYMAARGVEGLDGYFASGNAQSVVSGRLSYVLGLEGPSVTIDTACSSSLVAVHLAVQSLRSGESRVALAGATNLILAPENSITFSKHQMLSPDGRCKFGDARADGFVRGEGCAVLVLKRLRDARADGDPVLAIIRGSAVNQDGASSGLTAPNGPSQMAVLRAALADAGIEAASVGYIEAHGTGTALGDPIEIQALGEVYNPTRPADQPLPVGSAKTNFGHLEAAAGMAGLIKIVLMLRHGRIPASLHFETPNPHIDWDELRLRIPVALEPWPAAGLRIAGVSAFGFSGTNAHLLLQEAEPPSASPPTGEHIERPLHVLALSAQSDGALRTLAQRYAALLGEREATPPRSEEHMEALSFADVAFTANSGRSHFAHRLTVVAAESPTAAAALKSYLNSEEAPGLHVAHLAHSDPPRIAFLFTGQGAQYAGMGKALYDQQPIFRDALDRCAALLAGHLDRPLLELLFAEPGSEAARALDKTDYTQPALVALQIALAELWRSWGVEPTVVMGHSVGEFGAAVAAGVLSPGDALKLVAARGRLMGGLPAGGAMAAIFAPDPEVAACAAEHGAVVAAINGPAHTVVSGSEAAVLAVANHFGAQGVRTQRLNVSHAFHSPLMEPVLDELEATAAQVTLQTPRLRLISNVTGASAGAEIASPAYWRRHAREPVRFAQSVAQLAALECTLCIEIGPHPTLIGMAQAILPPETRRWLPSLRKGRDDIQQMLESVAGAYLQGATIDWAGFDSPFARHKLTLPTYPYQRESYWIKPLPHSRAPSAPRTQDSSADVHPLLGGRLRSALAQTQFEQELRRGMFAYLDDHIVFGKTLLPAAGLMEAALAAFAAALQSETLHLEDFVVHAPLLVGEDAPHIIQTVVTTMAAGVAVEIFGQVAGDGAWTRHASAAAHMLPPHQEDTTALASARARCTEELAVGDHYATLQQRGMELGPGLQSVRRIWHGSGEALGELALGDADSSSVSAYLIHPALLDGCLQLLAATLPGDLPTYLPLAVDEMRFYRRPGVRALVSVRLQSAVDADLPPETLAAEVRIYDETGGLLVALDGLRLKRADTWALSRAENDATDDWLYEVVWRPISAGDELLAHTDTLPVVDPTTIAASVHARIPALDAELDLAHYSELVPALEVFATDAIVNALCALGWRPQPGDRFASAALVDQLGVIPAYAGLLDRYLAILGEEGWLLAADGGWQVVTAPPACGQRDDEAGAQALSARAAALLERFPAARGEIEMTRRCAEALTDALRGAADPLQLLFPSGSLSTAEQLYRQSPLSRAFTTLFGEAVATVARTASCSDCARPLRVLEIGAGTGGATAMALPQLDPAHTHYTFTDISPHFLVRARESFRDYPFVEYTTLDLESDPLAQGFEAHSFDLILAANVVHATADLHRSLAHMHTLLAPSGVLLLLEMTEALRWIDLTFGLTSGWWRFADHDLRSSYPLIDSAAWLKVLESSGFEEAVALPAAANAGAGLAHQHILFARIPAQRAPSSTLPRSLLIFADEGGIGDRLGALVNTAGGRAALVRRGTHFAQDAPDHFRIAPNASGDIDRLLHAGHESAAGGWDAVAYLWPLDVPAWANGAEDPTCGQEALLGEALLLVKALVSAGAQSRLWLATRGAQPAGGVAPEPAQATLWGFARSLALEHPELRTTCVDLDPAPSTDSAAALFDEILRDELENAARRGEQRLAPHLARAHLPAQEAHVASETEAVALVIPARGAIDNLVLQPAQRRAPGPGEIELRIAATGLNFRDVMNVLGVYPGDPGAPGSECAGVVVRVGPGAGEFSLGDEVVTLAGGTFRSYATVDATFAARRPSTLSAEEAAALSIAYITADYALRHVGHIRAGERVLIHAAAGGVGLAAVHIAQRAGATVFATAGDTSKQAYLRSLGVEQVFSSRSLDFADGVLAATKGEGVDLVLNSLAGEFVLGSIDLLRAGGRMLELGKRDAQTEAAAVVAAAARGIVDVAIDWGETARTDPALIRSLLHELLGQVGRGELPVLPLTTFPLHEAAAAFRYMAQARHIGKIVITQRDAEGALVRPDASYLITGGLGGLGLLTARWLIEQGARHLALMGRSEPSAHTVEAIATLEQTGARVLVIRGDVAQPQAVAAALAEIAAQLPPLRGIIHAAGVLDDGVLTQQEWARFRSVLAPKVDGALLLHEQTAALPLDFFVLYSSAASMVGSPGQANHAAANAFLDALAQRRRAEGLPGLSINWGAWGEVGAATVGDAGTMERRASQGLGTIAPAQGLDLLGRLLRAAPAQVGVIPIDWPRFLGRFGDSVPPYFAGVSVARAPTQASALPAKAAASITSPHAGRAEAAPSTDDFVRRLVEAAPQRRVALLRDFVRETTGHVLGLAPARIADEQPFSALGLDSLMAVELRNLLGVRLALGRHLPATLVFDHPNVAAVATYLLNEVLAGALPAVAVAASTPTGGAATAPEAGENSAALATMLDALDDLSDEEIERLLNDRLRDGT